MFIKSVEPACRHPAEVYGRRAKPADRHAATDEPGKDFQRPVGLVQVGLRKARYQAGRGHRSLGAYGDLLVVQCGAIAPLCEKEFLYKRIIHRPQYYLSVLLQADGDTAER